jgi:hypothetical protein
VGRAGSGQFFVEHGTVVMRNAPRYDRPVPITVFDAKGIPATRRESIEAAVEAAGRNLNAPHEAWISADPFRGGFKVLVTGAQGLERSVSFALDEEPAFITSHVRAALED